MIKDENVAYWTARAATYSEVNKDELANGQQGVWSRELRDQIADALPWTREDPAGARALEVGCGPGFLAIVLAQAGFAVTAVDYTPAMLEAARANAGELAGRIDFRQADAEALDLPDASFDVVVSRNLTWDLPHPRAAYASWLRVLRPGGVLLVYDANWYGHLFDPEARAAYEADRSATARVGVKDEYAGTDISAMERIARRMPLSPVARPAWDAKTLAQLGAREVRCDEHAWERVFSAAERVNYASTPMFLVRAVR